MEAPPGLSRRNPSPQARGRLIAEDIECGSALSEWATRRSLFKQNDCGFNKYGNTDDNANKSDKEHLGRAVSDAATAIDIFGDCDRIARSLCSEGDAAVRTRTSRWCRRDS